MRAHVGECLNDSRLGSAFYWNASGTALYLETTVNGVQNLWRVQVDPATLEWRSAERLTTDVGSDVAAALSRDGTRLAYTQQNVSTRLWAFRLDASAARLLGEGRPVTEAGAVAESSSLSPDGRVGRLRDCPSRRASLGVVGHSFEQRHE